jgi:hypothetical protein
MTPISPTEKVEEGKQEKRRYSVAAVELIESQLRHKRQVSELRVQG